MPNLDWFIQILVGCAVVIIGTLTISFLYLAYLVVTELEVQIKNAKEDQRNPN